MSARPDRSAGVRAAGRVALGLALVVGRAALAGVDEDLSRFDQTSAVLEAAAVELEGRANAGLYFSAAEAEARFEEAVYRHLLGDYETSASALHALVTTDALQDPVLRADAERYLAEAMERLGNLRMAAYRYEEMAAQPDHPYRTQAVISLLQLYSALGRLDDFKVLYDREVVPGTVRATPAITYALAKSFWIQGDRASARSYFDRVPPDSAFGLRARYFQGVVDVADGRLDDARTRFTAVADAPVTTDEDRAVHDLAQMALGRLAYARQDWSGAFAAYQSVASTSPLLDQRLYETVWTAIRAGDYPSALNDIDVFLIGFPEHAYTGQFRVLQGHLASREKLWADAEVAYDAVITEYEPLRRRFADLAAPGTDPASEQRVDEFLRAPELSGLPAFAVAMVQDDAELGRALDLFGEIRSQETGLDASGRLIDELGAVFDSALARVTFDALVLSAWSQRSEALGHRLTLLGAEGRWAGTERVAAGRDGLEARWRAIDGKFAAAKAEIDTFRQSVAGPRLDLAQAEDDLAAADRRLAELGASASAAETEAERAAAAAERDQVSLQRRDALARMSDANRKLAGASLPDVLAGLGVEELDTLESEVNTLTGALAGARTGTRLGSPTAAHFDTLHARLRDVAARLGAAGDTLRTREADDLQRLRGVWQAEVGNVAAESAAHDALAVEARAASLDAARAGFSRMADWFGEAVRKADIGIVDAAWAQRLETADALEATRREMNDELSELDREFARLREKLGKE